MGMVDRFAIEAQVVKIFSERDGGIIFGILFIFTSYLMQSKNGEAYLFRWQKYKRKKWNLKRKTFLPAFRAKKWRTCQNPKATFQTSKLQKI